MEGSHAAASTKVDSATGLLRPLAHGQFKLLPIPLPHQRDWNTRVVAWARTA
ncbi:MAG: hypothetical protein M3Y22_04080 [Pseudomonadota bacterium]|nr:hypothetical protein [Pseudomonadota bacterium]